MKTDALSNMLLYFNVIKWTSGSQHLYKYVPPKLNSTILTSPT